ncbi:MAG: T9SS type A sorting domain-containing protein, partial [bacterium]
TSFPFSKLENETALPVNNWDCWGESFDEDSQTWAGEAPADYAVLSVTPNPFNPETIIRYALPSAGAVNLTIYDLAGRQVAVLVDGFRTPGIHEAVFNATHLASGVYVYRLQAENFKVAGKLLLLK